MSEGTWNPAEFIEHLRQEGARRYHEHHPFNLRMHEGALSQADLQRWVINRYYYQTRIPLKDALIVSKSEDRAFRRMWIHRIQDHDGSQEHEGGLSQWLTLAEAVGLDRSDVESCRRVLPGVRFACDAYVTFVREASLAETVAASLTELFAPDLMSKRIAAWERHYAFVRKEALDYFRTRVVRARDDSAEAVTWLSGLPLTRDLQNLCVAALVHKTRILWHLLDCVDGKLAPFPEVP